MTRRGEIVQRRWTQAVAPARKRLRRYAGGCGRVQALAGARARQQEQASLGAFALAGILLRL